MQGMMRSSSSSSNAGLSRSCCCRDGWRLSESVGVRFSQRSEQFCDREATC